MAVGVVYLSGRLDNTWRWGLRLQKNELMKITLTLALICLSLLGLASCSLWKSEKHLFPVKQNNKWGYIDNTGKIIIEPQFQFADKFSEGLALVDIGNRKMGYIDHSGQFVINPQFGDAGKFSEGLAFVLVDHNVDGRVERKAAYIDKTGKIILEPPQLIGGLNFHDGLASVRMGTGDKSTNSKDKFGYIDKSGKQVINLQFESVEAYDFSEGLAAIEAGGVGYIDKTGTLVVKPQFDEVLLREGISLGKKAELASFSEGFAAVCQGKPRKCGFIDKSGNVVIALQFDLALPFSEELAVIKIGDKYGFVDKSGKIIINPQFDGAMKFSEGLAWVMTDKKSGYIDKTGKMVITPQFDFAQDFSQGLALVQLGMGSEGKIGYIDKSGKYIWNPTK